MYLKTITIFTAILLSCTIAYADCETRPTTQAERDFETSTLTAIKKAMPAAPSGWKIDEESRIKATEHTCRGAHSPVDFKYTISYLRKEHTAASKQMEEVHEKREAERSRLKKDYKKSPEYTKDEERLSETFKLINAAARRIVEAAGKKDTAGQKNAEADLNNLQKEQQAIYAKRGQFFQNHVNEENLDHDAARKDTSAGVLVSIDDPYSSGMPKANAFTPANTKLAFSWEAPHLEGSSLMITNVRFFYGDWKSEDKSDGKKVFSPVVAKGGKGGQARRIYVTVTANDKDRATELAKKTDLDAIKALVAK